MNQIIHMQYIGNKLINLPTQTPAPDHILDLVNIPLINDWYNSIFSNDKKMVKFITFSAPFFMPFVTTRYKNTQT